MKKIAKNIGKFIKKHDNLFVIILIIISALGITLNVLITNSDELWNFQSVYKMYNGHQIYKDFNVIITPLFFMIGEILFKIFGANFLTFRIYNLIIITAMYFITYLLLKTLGIRKKISIIILLILMIIKKYLLILCQANYNNMALMIYLLGVLIYLKKYKYNNVLQGIILFLLFCTKQNVCVYYGIGLFIYGILQTSKVKEKIKNLIIEFIIFITLIIGLLTIFYINNNLYEFISFTVLGIKEFANENISINISSILLVISSICINLTATVLFIKNEKIRVKTNEKEKLILLNCFAIPIILMIVPIMNDAHLLLGIYLSIILFIYILGLMMKKIEININCKIIDIILLILTILLLSISMYRFHNWMFCVKYMKEEYNITNKDPFYGGIIEEKTIENIIVVTNYITNSSDNVIVLSGKAALYMVPLQRNNGIFDLPFKGNLGKEGESGLMDQIKNLKNTVILLEKDEENAIWQESKLVRKYIIENMTQIGEIEEFYIYE